MPKILKGFLLLTCNLSRRFSATTSSNASLFAINHAARSRCTQYLTVKEEHSRVTLDQFTTTTERTTVKGKRGRAYVLPLEIPVEDLEFSELEFGVSCSCEEAS